MITIAVIRETDLINDADVGRLIIALQTQVHTHFAPPLGADRKAPSVPILALHQHPRIFLKRLPPAVTRGRSS